MVASIRKKAVRVKTNRTLEIFWDWLEIREGYGEREKSEMTWRVLAWDFLDNWGCNLLRRKNERGPVVFLELGEEPGVE